MPLIIFLAIGLPVILTFWLVRRAVSARNRIEELSSRIDLLERDVFRLKHERPAVREIPVEPVIGTAVSPTPAAAPPVVATVEKPFMAKPPVYVPQAAAKVPLVAHKTPPVVSAPIQAPPPPPKPAVNWEQFMGVKGFAWLGGFALFLGVAFFVKYSFDNNLVPPALRVVTGFMTGLGLLVGGVALSRKNYSTLSQTLCATGVVILYAVTFACHSVYHFEFFGAAPTFLLMALITTTAFLLAVRLNARVVAVLGMLGGFLTPILLSTGQDNPLGLFGYIAILDAGLILVALNRRWHNLTTFAALGTGMMEVGWAARFFTIGKYFEGDRILIPLAVLGGFNALWLAANWFAKRRANSNGWLAAGNLGLAGLALVFLVFFFTFPALGHRPVLLLSFVFLIDLMVAALEWLDKKTSGCHCFAGLAVFGLLGLWTSQFLTNELLTSALVFYFLFAVFHTAFPAVLYRGRGMSAGRSTRLHHLFPPLALLLVLVPIFKLAELSFVVWPFVLLIDLLAIALAAFTISLLPVVAVLVLTFAATGALIFKIPATLTGLPISFFLLGAFAVFFVGAGVWLLRRMNPAALKSGPNTSGESGMQESIAAMVAASSAVLPFLLLIMATGRLPLANPSPVFGLAMLLVVLLLGLTIIFSFGWLPIVGLLSAFAVEFVWHFERFDVANPHVAPSIVLGWYLIFLAVFGLFPFLFQKKLSGTTAPWAASALAGPAQFFLIFHLVKAAWPNSVIGLLPAAFAIPALAGLIYILKTVPAENKIRMTQLAWFGGVGLFFITLIFPIQFDRQWITIGWALEGAALLWLFHRVPHSGLRLTGAGLLIAAFARLALNPAVLEYHQRSTTPIFNWYLYTYGIVTVALFVGARLLAPPRNVVLGKDARPVLVTLGTVLAFLLMNIEIADYFSAPGSTLTFQFSGNFGRDMTYSIAWALFALVLLVCGIYKRISGARRAAMVLLCVTLLKLFFHDLARLGPLYRIGAFIGVAIIAMLASFAYQKFYSASGKAEVKVEN